MFDEEVKGLEMKYFVLNPNKTDIYGIASREAIRTYADVIYMENDLLSTDIEKWLGRLRIERPIK